MQKNHLSRLLAYLDHVSLIVLHQTRLLHKISARLELDDSELRKADLAFVEYLKADLPGIEESLKRLGVEPPPPPPPPMEPGRSR